MTFTHPLTDVSENKLHTQRHLSTQCFASHDPRPEMHISIQCNDYNTFLQSPAQTATERGLRFCVQRSFQDKTRQAYFHDKPQF